MERFEMKFLLILFLYIPTLAYSDFPNRPVQIVLGMSSASTFPAIVRSITDNVPDKNFKFVNIHRVGQGNLIAYQHVLSSRPDGYTVGFASTSVVTNLSLHRQPGYSLDEIEPIAYIGHVDSALVVHQTVPFRTVNDLVNYAKRNPNKLLYGHNGFATQSFLFVEFIATKKNLKFTNVPYKGSETALIDLLSGQIDFHVGATSRIHSLSTTNRIRVIATTGSSRSSLFPSTPTVSETIPGVDSYIWYIFFVHKNTPDEIKQRLRRILSESLTSETTKANLLKIGLEIPKNEISMANLSKFVSAEYVKWDSLIKSKNIQTE